ncbi:MAG: hypothetical protein ACD_16C00015G0001 [uncultured bacterium]|nr:MAG: hypothetical protein ACD_16C00015G0001 [uncultured bacterium]
MLFCYFIQIFVEFRHTVCRLLCSAEGPAHIINRTEKPVQGMYSHGAVAAPYLHCGAGAEPYCHIGSSLAHSLCNPDYLLFRDACKRGSPLRGSVLEFKVPPFYEAVGLLLGKSCLINDLTCLKKVLAVFKISHKFLAPESFRKDHMGKGCCKGAVLTRYYRKPLVSLCGGCLHSRVNNGNSGVIKHIAEPFDYCRNHPV